VGIVLINIFGCESFGEIMSVRVVTYNILCSTLAPADRFCHCKPEDLAAPARLQRILKQLDVEVASGAVVCLQEVGREWAGDLHQYFFARGFHFVHSGYGESYNDYMGMRPRSHLHVPRSSLKIPASNFNPEPR
jgi:mRNA deadenylase 3'-5' endonuclease subunit Ccr4